MKIDILTKNLTISDALYKFIEDKISTLDKFLKNYSFVEARVEISKPSKHHRSGPVFYAEANLLINGKLGTLLRADATHLDLRTAIVKVKDELQRQIKRFKQKPKDKLMRKEAPKRKV